MITRSGLFAIFRKELYRFFTDRRAVITTVLLPGLMIYLIYAAMGEAIGSMLAIDENYRPNVMVVNAPSFLKSTELMGILLTTVEPERTDVIKDAIAAKTVDLLVVFPADFDQQLSNILENLGAENRGTGSTRPPVIELYYNSTVAESVSAFGMFSELLVAYRDALFTPFVINPETETGMVYDLATDQDMSGFLLSSLLPMLIIIFLFNGCLAVAPESIAGEKERGTIATLLVTPLKRYELALGKVLALSSIALLAATSSFIGIIASIPRLMAGASDITDISIYSAGDYVLLFAVILSTVLLFVGLLSLISAFAKTVKEASTLAMPFMIIVILVAVGGSFAGVSDNALLYLIPSFSSTQCLAGVLSFNVQPLFIVETIVVNIIYTGLCVFILTRMFNSERVVFAR